MSVDLTAWWIGQSKNGVNHIESQQIWFTVVFPWTERHKSERFGKLKKPKNLPKLQSPW